MAGQAIDFPWDKLNVTGDLAVCSRPCVLHSITFNGMTTVGDVAIYDGTDNTGTLIATLILRSAVQVSCQPYTLLFDCEMLTGIFFDYSSLVGNFTVMFR